MNFVKEYNNELKWCYQRRGKKAGIIYLNVSLNGIYFEKEFAFNDLDIAISCIRSKPHALSNLVSNNKFLKKICEYRLKCDNVIEFNVEEKDR